MLRKPLNIIEIKEANKIPLFKLLEIDPHPEDFVQNKH